MKNIEKQAKMKASNMQLRPFLSNKSMVPKKFISIVSGLKSNQLDQKFNTIVQISHLRLRKKHRKNCECCPGHYLIANH